MALVNFSLVLAAGGTKLQRSSIVGTARINGFEIFWG